MKIKFFSFLLFTLFSVFSISSAEPELLLRDNLKRSQPGDYLVTAQSKNYTVLLVRGKEGEQLSIEEITIPMSRVPEKDFSWRDWLQKGSKGHTCWVMYNINLSTGILQQTFSFTKNEWVNIPQSQNFLTTLLNLRLKQVPSNERKKIGPPPASDVVDRRPVWQPQLIVDGQVVPNVSFDMWRTRWPKDNTDLSGKVIEVYLPMDNNKYPAYFPYWLQISGLLGKAKVRIVDSGSNIVRQADNKT